MSMNFRCRIREHAAPPLALLLRRRCQQFNWELVNLMCFRKFALFATLVGEEGDETGCLITPSPQSGIKVIKVINLIHQD